MHHFHKEEQAAKGWFVGPWNSSIPVAVGYANEGINEPHFHTDMFEVYLVAQGRSTALVDGERVVLEAGSVLVVEPGEVHTFVEGTPDYYHFVVHTPVVKGDKHLPR
jgi:quercetin dioxygenase-like cupin family protein